MRLLYPCFLVLAAACSTPGQRIDRLYTELARDVVNADPRAGPDSRIEERNRDRARSVHAILAEGEPTSANDLFKAAVLLVETDALEDLKLAAQLAEKAFAQGEPRGRRVVAEAVDKQLLISGAAQLYGTQYVYEPVLDSWRLYPIDPRTTDEVRATMGVATYAELLRAEDAMNVVSGRKLRKR